MARLDDTILDKYVPDGPISSLRRIQTLYGAMAEAAAGEAAGEFGLYFTPGELEAFTTAGDDDRVLATVRVDLTSDEPRLDDVEVETFRPERIDVLGFARYPWGRGIDHSITRRGAKGGSSRDTVVRYCRECLERWTNASGKEQAVGQVADDHPDGWVIRDLGRLGSREDIDADLTRILEAAYPSGEPRVTATVAVKLDESSLKHSPESDPDDDGYYYPGQLHVLNAGMKARKDLKLARKNLEDSDPPSRGEGACMVTGERGEVFGTVEDPLAFFTVQHTEKFASLSKPESWRSHPVSVEVALLLQSGKTLVEACSDTRGGLRVYTIPYFVDADAQRAELLYESVGSDDDVTMARVYEDIRDDWEVGVDPDELRFYVIGVRNESGDINVLFEVPNADIYWPRRVADAHAAVIDDERTTTFSAVAGFARPQNEWRTLDASTDSDSLVNAITTGMYAFDTLPDPDADAPPADDSREWLTRSLLTGERVNADRLLTAYVDRLTAERRDGRQIGFHTLSQYAQFEALASVDLLAAPEDRPELSTPPLPMTTEDTTDDVSSATTTADGGTQARELPDVRELAPNGNPTRTDVRRYRLHRFLSERKTLDANDERRGAFLSGVLIGQLSDHQSTPEEYGGRGMNRTIRDRHPPDQMTADRLYRLYTGEIERLPRVYGRERGHGPMFPETRECLATAFGDAKPTDWTLPTSDLRFFYALGLEYGSNAGYQAMRLENQLDLSTGSEQQGERHEQADDN